jgi:hypothetical protein
MFQIPGINAAGNDQAADIKENDSPKTNYLTVDPDSGSNARRVWAAATQSPMAKMPGAVGADAGQSTPNPRTVAEQDVLQYSTPTSSRDAQGKTLPKYRMGIGQRILGTFANFANGFAGKGGNPVYVGPGALNNRYYQDEQERQQNLAGAKLRLGTLAKQPPDQTSLEDTPPEQNKNIPPAGPVTPRQGRYKASLRPAALNRTQPGAGVSLQASVPATTLGRTEAEQYLSMAQGNKDLARKLARLDGHIV